MSYDFSKQYIGGVWTPSTGNGWIEVENPATEAFFARVPEGTTGDIDLAVAVARAAFPAWSATTLEARCALMEKVLVNLAAKESDIVPLEVQELGAPVGFTRVMHFQRNLDRIRSYIDLARTAELKAQFAASTVYREPHGVVACVTPWNYPLGQVVQKVVPAILMGNTVVLKPSQHTPLTAYLLVEAFEEAGLPAGVLNLVSGRGAALGEYLVTHPDVDMFSFTGSTRVGVLLAQKALTSVKRIALELGGKSPFIWLPGMKDYTQAIEKLVASIFLNSGQTCTALSRLIVPREALPTVEAALIAATQKLTTGDPTLEGVDLGPVSSRAQYKKVTEFIQCGLDEGARLIAGGVPQKSGPGYFIAPTIFSDVKNSMRIAQEEIFGPVLCVIAYDSIDEAVAIANNTVYGLNAAVWGEREEAETIARRIRAGNVYVNDAPRDVTAPFGGMKASGLGREGGLYGLLEFTEPKAIYDRSTF